MANPFRELFFGPTPQPRHALVEILTPRRSFADVVLPPATLRALRQALAQIEKHDVLFQQWGLGERHSSGLGLAFNFAGPPGTGKTICAEAIAHALSRPLLLVRYAELESMWAGATGKNVAEVFRWAEEEAAVLFFDEADAVASRRFQSAGHGYEREANAVVNVLLRELEEFAGVVIFATNLAASFDPAFERRIRTHILFSLPDVPERERIWKLQLHPRKTPLAEDVDFAALAAGYAFSGGDIKNAVLKAAQAALAEPGPDAQKRIHQRHFVAAAEEVRAAHAVMGQSLFGAEATPGGWPTPPLPLAAEPGAVQLEEAMGELRAALEAELAVMADRVQGVERVQKRMTTEVQEAGAALARRQEAERAEQQAAGQATQASLAELRSALSELEAHGARLGRRMAAVAGALLLLVALALVLALTGCAPAATAGSGEAGGAGGWEGAPLRVLVYNIHAGKDAAGADNLERVAALVRERGADVVLLQEVDRRTRRSGGVDQLAELTRRTGMHGAFGKTLDFQGGEYGIAVLSRWPIRRDTLIRLPVEPPQERAGGSHEPRGALLVRVAAPGGELQVVNTHLDASAEEWYRLQEAAQLRRIAEALPSAARVLIGGDLNSTPESAVLRRLASGDWRDGWVGCGAGEESTYPAARPAKRIDYLLLPEAVRCRRAEVIASEASDHRPLLFELEPGAR